MQAAWGVQGTGEPVGLAVPALARSLQVLSEGARSCWQVRPLHRMCGTGRSGLARAGSGRPVVGAAHPGEARLWRTREQRCAPRGLSSSGGLSSAYLEGLTEPRSAYFCVLSQAGQEAPRVGRVAGRPALPPALGWDLPCPARPGSSSRRLPSFLAVTAGPPGLPGASPALRPVPQHQHGPVTLGFTLGGSRPLLEHRAPRQGHRVDAWQHGLQQEGHRAQMPQCWQDRARGTGDGNAFRAPTQHPQTQEFLPAARLHPGLGQPDLGF